MDFSKLTGYEFEDYIAKLFRQKGFEVEQTDYSGDGGADIIVKYNEPLLSGKYIVQCKNYTGLVGQPELRDLYGVVMSENANKGILITPSDFSEQAYAFAKGKQLELINGEILRKLSGDDSPDYKSEEIFYLYEGFNTSRYNYLKKSLENSPTDEANYRQMYDFLRSYITGNCVEICKAGLFAELIGLIQQWKSRCYKGKSARAEQGRTKCSLLLADIYLIMGEVAEAAEILLSLGKNYYKFIGYEPFWPYEILWGSQTHQVKKSSQNVQRHARFFLVWNLYVTFKSLGYWKGCQLITEPLIHIEKAEDYITCDDSDSKFLNFHGIDNAFLIPSPKSYYNYTETEYNDLFEGIQSNYEWYQKFEQGLLDDRFLFFSSITPTSDKVRHWSVTIQDFDSSETSLSAIREAYWTKTDEELRTELDQVFLNHGL